jgi:hypothetical protein
MLREGRTFIDRVSRRSSSMQAFMVPETPVAQTAQLTAQPKARAIA